MTKSTITRERAEQLANFKGAPVTRQEEQELARIALAAMDSEPVAYWRKALRADGFCYADGINSKRFHDENPPFPLEDGDYWEIIPLYRHAQPAPVVPEEMPSNLRGLIEAHTDRLFDDDDAQEIWNACRAAILQAGDAVRDLSTPVDPQVAEYEQNVMQAGNSPVIPDGYVMVPVKPTREILDEFDSIIDYGAEDSEDAWRRLLAAAPKEVK